ncbi:MAG: glycosyltransferase [Candidatus Aegiribacteria sp.]|nr:glycosyltransferase [Candidatus Aegiribacteria sp.]
MEKIKTTITVVVPVHNGGKTLEAVLDPLGKELSGGDELVVVDDRSDDRSREIATLFGATVISSSGSPGAAGARNTGALAAAGEWVLFVDSDAVAPPGWRDMLQQRIDHGSSAVQATYSPVGAGKHAATFYKNFYYYYTFTRRISSEYITGCGTFFFAVERSLFLELNGFDDRIPGATVEDADFAARLVGAGGKILMAPEIEVYHLREYTFSELMRYEWNMMRSKILYLLRRSRDHAVPSVSMATPVEMLPVLCGAACVWLIPVGLTAYAAGCLWGIWLGAAGFLILTAVHAGFWLASVREAGMRGLIASLITLPDLMLIVPAVVSGVIMHLTGRKY